MKKLVYYFLLLLMIGSINLSFTLSSNAETKTPIKENALTRHIKISEQKLNDAPIKYPQISGAPNSTAQQTINNLLKQGADTANNNRLKLLEDEKEAKAKWDSSQGPWRPYEYVFTYKVLYNNLDKLSIIYKEYSYTGGAHGMTTGTTYNFDVKTGEIVPLSKLINENTKSVQEYAYQQLQKKYKGYVLIKSPNEIDLSDKNRLWAFDHAGIKLIFKEYEVAAYAAGMPEVFIPVQVYQ
ncbi:MULTISPECIES: DUF3298 and DUF4163 domain-containing protein [unclassified Bacillus (in: firmicutes)]|uniref:DUF3298 and DUF4163 domain-containing protein n=1 Tax=unclassified Bacillus (in: firmicutes) TaxID=185979 RepID=UPI000BF10CEC|nr:MULTISPECIES: DUF3298 and DUF4163 domain-containing protein [unclassified Bacillus (in: firmicutes)]PEJ58177.1 hypothetical protein CN692_07790 [Bacillus sp. AFS002410]PEL12052.1 hypothetical protein CN601_08585 [Bacillus sp. AFS017336]